MKTFVEATTADSPQSARSVLFSTQNNCQQSQTLQHTVSNPRTVSCCLQWNLFIIACNSHVNNIRKKLHYTGLNDWQPWQQIWKKTISILNWKFCFANHKRRRSNSKTAGHNYHDGVTNDISPWLGDQSYKKQRHKIKPVWHPTDSNDVDLCPRCHPRFLHHRRLLALYSVPRCHCPSFARSATPRVDWVSVLLFRWVHNRELGILLCPTSGPSA